MDGNLAMNSQFENMSEKDSNDMAEHYITLEGNELVAQFMGYVQEETVDEGWLMWKRNKEDAISFRTLTFDRNWSELMPVVEKIADTPMEEFINEETEDGGYAYPITFGMRDETGQWMVRFRGHGLHYGESLIQAAWNAVVDFIKWHNTQNPQQ